jgi:lipoprotein NlpD
MIIRKPTITLFYLLISSLLMASLVACGVPHRTGIYHTVKKGQTLYTISRVYEVDEAYLARINGVSDPTQLMSGERIFIPGASQVKSVPITVKPAPPPKPKPVVVVKKDTVPVKKPVASKPVPKPSYTKPTTTSKKPPASKGRFIWPVKGQVVKKFGNGTSKGLEIAVNSGTPVASAAAGKVIYSGSGISGYGNLVIVRHDDSFFTVYGYNKRNIVDAGAFVSKGEKIAYSGKPPSGGKNRVYFEIRYGKKPVNPLTYLP